MPFSIEELQDKYITELGSRADEMDDATLVAGFKNWVKSQAIEPPGFADSLNRTAKDLVSGVSNPIGAMADLTTGASTAEKEFRGAYRSMSPEQQTLLSIEEPEKTKELLYGKPWRDVLPQAALDAGLNLTATFGAPALLKVLGPAADAAPSIGRTARTMAAGVETGLAVAGEDYAMQQALKAMGAVPPETDYSTRNQINLALGAGLPVVGGLVGGISNRLRGRPGAENLSDITSGGAGPAAAAGRITRSPASGTPPNLELGKEAAEDTVWAAKTRALTGGKWNEITGEFEGGSSAPLPARDGGAIRNRIDADRTALATARSSNSSIIRQANSAFVDKKLQGLTVDKIFSRPDPSIEAMGFEIGKDAKTGAPIYAKSLKEIDSAIAKTDLESAAPAFHKAYTESVGRIYNALMQAQARNGGFLLPTDLEAIRADVIKPLWTASGQWDINKIAQRTLNPSRTTELLTQRQNVLKQLYFQSKNWIEESLMIADPSGGLATRWGNNNDLLHHGSRLLNMSESAYVKGTTGHGVSDSSNLMDRGTGRMKLPGMLGSGGTGRALVALDQAVGAAVPPVGYANDMATIARNNQAFSEGLAIMDGMRNGVTVPDDAFRAAQFLVAPSMAMTQSLQERARQGEDVSGFKAAITPIPTQMDGRKIIGAAPATPTPTPTPMPTIVRDVNAVEKDPIAAVAFQQAAGPDVPYLVQQYSGIHNPEEKAKFWAEVAKQYPEIPFEPGRVTGLASEFSDGGRAKLFDDGDKAIWRDKIMASPYREDIKAQLIAALHSDGTVYPLDDVGSLALSAPSFQPADLTSRMTRSRNQPKEDLING